ncbi:MAG: hypothetical protein WD115_04150 [Balneolaceae bacterium]
MIQIRPVGTVLLIYLGISWFLPFVSRSIDPIGWWVGTALGMLAPALHLMTTRWILRLHEEAFHTAFYVSLLIRTVVILGIFVALLVGTNIGKIAFTLSFIISYIFHSVIDIILIQKNEFNRRSNS